MRKVLGANVAQWEQSARSSKDASTSSNHAVGLRILWGQNTLFFTSIDPKRGFRIGAGDADDDTDFVVPSEDLGASTLDLISADRFGVYLNIPAQANGEIQFAPDRIFNVEELRMGLPVAESSLQRICLNVGVLADLHIGVLRFVVDCAVPERSLPRSFLGQAWQTTVPYFGASLLSVGSLLGAMAHLMPPLGLTDGEELSNDRLILMQSYLTAAAEREQQNQEVVADETETPSGGDDGAKSIAEEGALGKVDAPVQSARASRRGPKENQQPELSKLAEARGFGLIGILSSGLADPDGPTAAWARNDALGSEELSAQGHMWGDHIGDAAGMNGLELHGLGEGGGGRYHGIGLAQVGTWGSHGSCLAGEDCGRLGVGGIGRGIGRSTNAEHRTRAPNPRMGNPTVSGRVPAEVIQRIVRQNFGRFRHCYEQGLGKNPSLQGRVAIRFLIASDGSVAQAGNGGSSLSDVQVVNCVVRSFYGLSFPKPDGGTVTVTYPLMFTPS